MAGGIFERFGFVLKKNCIFYEMNNGNVYFCHITENIASLLSGLGSSE